MYYLDLYINVDLDMYLTPTRMWGCRGSMKEGFATVRNTKLVNW